jgi:hypothetical protein
MNITANQTINGNGADREKQTILFDKLNEEGRVIIDRLLGMADEGRMKRHFASKGESRNLV